MALIDEKRRPPSPLQVRPIVTGVAALVASFVFVVVTAVVARATADGVVMPDRDAGFPDAGPIVVDAGFADAGFFDAGMPYTVSLDAGVVDSGPATVDGPPFEAKDVVKAAVVVVEICAGEALRWDPSLGGAFTLVVDLPVGAPVAVIVDGLTSPVLSSCIARRTIDIAWPESMRSSSVAVPLQARARASLDGAGRVTWSDSAVTSGPDRPVADENVNDVGDPE